MSLNTANDEARRLIEEVSKWNRVFTTTPHLFANPAPVSLYKELQKLVNTDTNAHAKYAAAWRALQAYLAARRI